MNRGKEIKLDENDKFLIKIGTVDNKNPKSIFLTVSSWTHPKSDWDLNYDRIISNLRKKIKQTIYNSDTTIFDHNKTIVDLDLRSSGISINKKSYMSCEVTMFQNESMSIKSRSIIDYFNRISHTLRTDVFDPDPIFEYSVKK